MTDKVQKIREEIERLKEETSIGLSEHENGVEQGRMEIINALSLFLDSLQKEPVKIKKGCKYRCLSDMVNNDTGKLSFIRGKIYLAPEDDTLVSEENGWLCDTSENASNFELVEEPVSNPIDFEKELYKAFGQVKDFTLGMRIAKWFYDMGKNSQEPVSGLDNGDMPIERWKQAVEAASNQRNYRSSKGLTETRDDYFVDGVQWADEHPKEEPVSDDLEYASEKYACRFSSSKYGHDKIKATFKVGAKWQLEQMKEILRTEYEKGRYDMREQMLSKAVECEVKVDAGGYPYIPQIELYDYDNDVPLAKEGDKYKVILIKEECS